MQVSMITARSWSFLLLQPHFLNRRHFGLYTAVGWPSSAFSALVLTVHVEVDLLKLNTTNSIFAVTGSRKSLPTPRSSSSPVTLPSLRWLRVILLPSLTYSTEGLYYCFTQAGCRRSQRRTVTCITDMSRSHATGRSG